MEAFSMHTYNLCILHVYITYVMSEELRTVVMEFKKNPYISELH